MTTSPEISLISDTINTLNQRVSVRDYNTKPLDDATLLTILNAARRTATSSNTQTYSFVVIRDTATKHQLAHLAGDQQHIIDCPVFIAICADLTRLAQATALHGETMAVNLELSMVAIVDATLTGQSLSLAAESIGLGTVMIGGMRNHPQEVAELLHLPEGVFVVFGLCLGWYDEKPLQKPRLPEATVIHFERYQSSVGEDWLTAHDAELAQHYRDQGRKSPDSAWTGVIARKFGLAQRPFLRAVLEKRGFRFD
ncbi:MAG TPA: NADPH-dependent oxidoreductase [Phototrophicaceae bacterium]|nr:NADPH-dependent oxidoreductase [Phototrophicaceae bacterium]